MARVRPPLLYWLIVNPLRHWWERDDRLLVEQWRSTFAPEPKKVLQFLNLTVSREPRRKVA